jgi:MFS family permease
MLGAVLYGVATGVNSPTLFAWTVDLADPVKRGKAMSTLYISLEIGILFGALGSAWIYGNDAAMLPWAFATGALLSMVALVYLFLTNQRPS